MLWILPSIDGRAVVSTCRRNIFRAQNRIVVKRNINDAWNSREFQYQRIQASKKDWSFCYGACCNNRIKNKESINNIEVVNAIDAKKHVLDYSPKILSIIPSFKCNNACLFCLQKLHKRKAVLNDSLVREIKKEIIPHAEWIVISGGEPFSSDQSLELIDWIISQYPGKRVTVLTNGTLLHAFGLQRIMKHKIEVRVSFYGMSPRTYRDATGTENFDEMFNNVHALLKVGYEGISFFYLVSRYTVKDLKAFCDFARKHENINGIIEHNRFEGTRFQKYMKQLEARYSQNVPQLTFDYGNEGAMIRLSRCVYNPLHSLKYRLEILSGNMA